MEIYLQQKMVQAVLVGFGPSSSVGDPPKREAEHIQAGANGDHEDQIAVIGVGTDEPYRLFVPLVTR